jgi:hypothetical protein
VKLLLSAALVALVAAFAEPAAAQQTCPQQSFLSYDGLVYASDRIPTTVALVPGESIGTVQLDEPTDETGCERERTEVEALRLGDLDPKLAMAVQGREGVAFIMGARCAGYEGDEERWRCLLQPLMFGDGHYTSSSYPATPAPQGSLELGEPLGGGEIGGEAVTVATIQGVDPTVAVAVEGRPSEAFIAAGACPYEAFSNDEATNDLLRCLRGPVWLTFDPVGARPGAEVNARADRALGAELGAVTVALVRLRVAADALPDDLSSAVAIGALSASGDGGAELPFTIPELEQGLYEAVVTCDACAAEYAGQTSFPAGSLVVFEKKGGSSARPFLLAVGALGFVVIPLAFIAWRRGWHRGRPVAKNGNPAA